LESVGEGLSSSGNVSVKPSFLRSHEPENLGSRTVEDGFGEQSLKIVAVG